jgi:Uma2 family endonuclease
MSATISRKLITAEEFERYEQDTRMDLIRGELHPMPPMPGAEHGELTLKLSTYAHLFVIENDLGTCFAAETRFTIERNPDTSIGPDWAFVAKERLPVIMPTGFLPLAPDIVLEVRSPSDTGPDAQAKVERWLSAGVKLVWELNPRTRILTVHRAGRTPQKLGPEDRLSGEELLPGFILPLRRLFPAT